MCRVEGLVGGAVERGGNTLNGVNETCTENGSIPGQNLALTVLCVPCSLDSGLGSAGFEV